MPRNLSCNQLLLSPTDKGIKMSKCVHSHGTQCPLCSLFLLCLFLLWLLFSHKGLSQGSEMLHGVLTPKNIMFWVPPCPPGLMFHFFVFVFKEKYLALTEMARKLTRKLFTFPFLFFPNTPLSQFYPLQGILGKIERAIFGRYQGLPRHDQCGEQSAGTQEFPVGKIIKIKER